MAGRQAGYVYITVSGGEQFKVLARQLATWGMFMRSLEPAFEQIGEDLLGDFARNMLYEGGTFMTGVRGGSRWPPLAPSTIKEKQRLGYGAEPMLWRTGALARSLSEKGGPGNIFRAGADYVVVGSSLFYAPFHQNGSRSMKTVTNTLRVDVPREWRFSEVKVLPQRMIVGISWVRKSGIARRLNAYVQEMARRAGLMTFGNGGGEG